MITQGEYERFLNLRKLVFDKIRKSGLASGKSYEGSMSIFIEFPSFWDDEDLEKDAFSYGIRLFSYLIGPHRHYIWEGRSLTEALNKACKDIAGW